MEMILRDVSNDEIEKVYVQKSDRLKSSVNSKGNQLKWRLGNRFVKLNCLGYEDVAEVMVTWLLRFTNLRKDEYVEYQSCLIYEDGELIGNGCYSYDFVGDSEEVPLGVMLDLNMKSRSISYDDLRDFILDETSLDIKNYLDKILDLDSITKNEDRHFNNIVLLVEGEKYRFAPIFDNGDSCLSDLITYPFGGDLIKDIKRVQAKPFNSDFKKQLMFNERLLIRYDDFINSVSCTSEESKRAFEVIKYGLEEMEGISWERN